MLPASKTEADTSKISDVKAASLGVQSWSGPSLYLVQAGAKDTISGCKLLLNCDHFHDLSRARRTSFLSREQKTANASLQSRSNLCDSGVNGPRHTHREPTSEFVRIQTQRLSFRMKRPARCPSQFHHTRLSYSRKLIHLLELIATLRWN